MVRMYSSKMFNSFFQKAVKFPNDDRTYIKKVYFRYHMNFRLGLYFAFLTVPNVFLFDLFRATIIQTPKIHTRKFIIRELYFEI